MAEQVLSPCKARAPSSAARQHKVPRSPGPLCVSGHRDPARSRMLPKIAQDSQRTEPRKCPQCDRCPSFLSDSTVGGSPALPCHLCFLVCLFVFQGAGIERRPLTMLGRCSPLQYILGTLFSLFNLRLLSH